MSNAGQAVLDVVGLIASIYTGNPIWFTLAVGAGNALFPTALPSGPRISDNRTTTATIGNPVPIGFGTFDVAGTVIWLAPFVEHSQTQGGKGGPSQKTFSYTQSIGIGLCERVDDTAAADIGAIGGISRIWENGAIVYDIRPQQETDTALGTPAESDTAYANRLTVSAAYAETFTLYLGSEDQLADPTIEGIEGMGNVPAFRGLAYIVYPDRQLQTAQGLRHPNFTFEIFQHGTGQCEESTSVSNEILHPWLSSGEGDAVNTLNNNVIKIFSFDPNLPQYVANHSTWGTLTFGTTEEAAQYVDGYYTAHTGASANLALMGYRAYDASDTLGKMISRTGAALISSTPGVFPDPQELYISYAPFGGSITVFRDNAQRGAAQGTISLPIGTYTFEDTSTGLSLVDWVSGPAATSGDPGNIAPFTNRFRRQNILPSSTNGFWTQETQSVVLTVTRTPSAPTPPCAGLTLSTTNPGYAVRMDGKIIKCNDWVLDTSKHYKVLQQFTATGLSTVTKYPLNPCIGDDEPEYTDAAFWTDAYNAAVAAGTMASGLSYNSMGVGAGYPVKQNFAWRLDQVLCEASGQQANIGDIISAVCHRAGLTADQIDTTDVSSISVDGYSISNICDAANIIAPLRSIAFFDCVESGGAVKFPIRGKPIVATLTEDQFGCFDSSNATDPPPAITTARADETTLPRSIRLHYKSVARDYQDGEANSPFRLTTQAVDDQDVSVPVCLGDAQALQAAEIIWSDAWAAQNSHELSIDQALLELEGSDCIGVPIDGVIQRLRIVSDNNASGILRKLKCVRDSEGAYISFAVAPPLGHVPQTLTFLSPTLAEFLNLPALVDADNNAGFYIVAYPDPTSGNTWRGAQLFQSVDGVTFTPSVSITTAATVGTIDAAVPQSEFVTWDDVTEIIVNVSAGTTFESRTDSAVLAGANAAAMGADDRWEIVQFANAAQLSPTQWQLTRLLRGRRGTEHCMGSSQTGDKFILISTGDAVRVPLSVAQIGAIYDYKVTTAGAAFSTGTDYTFISRGTAMIPFAPVDAAAHAETSGDILLSWTRRDRLGQTLMSGMDIPLSDYPERFEVDICQGPDSPDSPHTVFRTLSTSTTSVVYSAADYTADYGGTGQVFVRIYQLSTIMGRGTAETVALTVI